MMAANDTESLDANSSSETRSVFYCPKSPYFIWDLNNTTSLEIVFAVTVMACPVTILLNLLVIIAVKKRRELKTNSHILLSSLAVADLLVGAVSMPLTITLDVLVLQRILFKNVICTIYSTSDFILTTLSFVSYFHLVLIAWDRNVAIVKWMKYKVIVTKDRVKKYAIVAWLLPLLMFVSLATIMSTVDVPYELIFVTSVILSIFGVGCLLFIIYCYVKVYLRVRKQNRTQILPVNVLVQANVERKIAYTTLWITLIICISGVPVTVLYIFGTIWPFLHESSIFRSAETMLQLNSLANPLLYFYKSRQFRKAALELLRCKEPQLMQPVARTLGRIRRRRCSMASLDVKELQSGPKRPSFVRSQSCGNVVGKIVPSTSLSENSFVTLTNCHQNASERNFKRSRSLPMLSTNLNTLDNKLTVAELTSEKETAWNSYEDTEL